MQNANYRKKKPKDMYVCGRGHKTIVREGKTVDDTCPCGAENDLVVSGERRPHEHRSETE